jgi:phenylacetate-coenzyme A ligase PaaK-like adenylate-forming protein
MKGQWNDKIFSAGQSDFTTLALEAFHVQRRSIPVYKSYTDQLGIRPSLIQTVEQIPFLPISFFKSHDIHTSGKQPELIFESSGTTGSATSRHHVLDSAIYRESFTRSFRLFYGPPSEWRILALLPSYIERSNSSLVYMVEELVRLSSHPESGFYLDEFDKLANTITTLESRQQKTLLLGVTFALLDFADYYDKHNYAPLRNTIIMETGGMKGRKEELTRSVVHTILENVFGVKEVHSEYGMTELLSQAYSSSDGLFQSPAWMKVLLREEDDPLSIRSTGERPGVINIIDLANIHSCCFIATDDVGRLHSNGRFEVLGRLDNSDLRGCSLLTI